MIFCWTGQSYGLDKKALENAASKAFFVLGEKDGRIEGKFVNQTEMARLNQVYLGREGVTDVLSFLLEEKPVEGQIFICYTYAKKEAEKAGIRIENEVIRLLIHGIVHLHGFDHHSVKEGQEMEKVIKRIEKELND